MFGIGWSELAVILCVAIIFIQPRDLPKLFRKLGKLYAQVKKAYAEITATKDQFVKDIEEAAALEEKWEAEAARETVASKDEEQKAAVQAEAPAEEAGAGATAPKETGTEWNEETERAFPIPPQKE
jgi:sec-independent protein translocase protein TatB